MIEATAFGRADAPFLFVMLSPPSEGEIAWFWRQLHRAGILKTQVRIVYLINETPMGSGNKPLKTQLRAAKDRFELEMKRSSPKVVVPMGTEPFRAVTGINESILDARGYLIRKHLFKPIPTEVWEQVGTYKNASRATGAKKGDPKMKWVTHALAGPLGENFKGVVIPAFTLIYIRMSQFSVAPAFAEDMKRAKRAFDGNLREVGKKFQYHSTLDQLPEPEMLGSLIAVDIETHGIDNEVIDLVSFSDGVTSASIEWTEGARVYMERMFALAGRTFAIHNSPFDIPRLVRNGVRIKKKVINEQVFDTMFGGVQLQPDLHKSLGRMASIYIDLEPWKTSSRNKTSHWRALVQSDPRAYSAKDSFYTYWLAYQLISVMKKLGTWRYFMGQDNFPGPGVMATIPELTLMTEGGLRISRTAAAHMCHRLERRLLRYMQLWTMMFPKTVPSSNPQIQKLLYKYWGLPLQRSKEDGVSVDELSLVRLQAYVRNYREDANRPGRWQTDERSNPRTFDLLLKIRETSKLLSTYVQPAMDQEDLWVHPSYMPVSKDDERGGKKMSSKGNTATGRLASYGPNIQNQPKRVRSIYVPDTDGMCFVQGDLRSAELYALAGASGDERLLSDLNSAIKGGMHQLNADRLTAKRNETVSRDTAKNVTYASQYLAGGPKMSEMILEDSHVWISPEECQEVADGIWSYYTKATAYKALLIEMSTAQGYIINPFGRIRFFHGGAGPAAVNFIPQSIVADILWCVLKRVAIMARKLGGRLVTTVHDSILICVPAGVREQAAHRMKEIMETRFDCVRKGFFIPVEIEMGEPGASWGDLKKWELPFAA